MLINLRIFGPIKTLDKILVVSCLSLKYFIFPGKDRILKNIQRQIFQLFGPHFLTVLHVEDIHCE